jgi:hypothetical protein
VVAVGAGLAGWDGCVLAAAVRSSDGTNVLALTALNGYDSPGDELRLAAIPFGAASPSTDGQTLAANAASPDLAADGVGNVYVGWEAWYGGSFGAIVARRTASGGVQQQDLGSGYGPHVAANAAGRAAAIWFDYQQGVVRVALRSTSDGAFGAPIVVSAQLDSGTSPDVAVTADGAVVMAWPDPAGGIVARVLRADGTLTTQYALGDGGTMNAEVTAAGVRAVVLWKRRLTPDGLFGGTLMSAVIGPDGPAGPTQTLGSGAEGYEPGNGAARVAGLPDGRVLIAWRAFSASGSGGQWTDTQIREGDLDAGVVAGASQSVVRGGMPPLYGDGGAVGGVALQADGSALVARPAPRALLRPSIWPAATGRSSRPASRATPPTCCGASTATTTPLRPARST